MMANTVSLVASPAVAYVDATRTSSFYGTYYTFPTDRNERGIPIRLRLGYIVGGILTPGEPHPDSYYETSMTSTVC